MDRVCNVGWIYMDSCNPMGAMCLVWAWLMKYGQVGYPSFCYDDKLKWVEQENAFQFGIIVDHFLIAMMNG